MKIVLDSNVIVAGFAAPGLCHEILGICLLEHELIVSAFILEETERILTTRIKIPPAETQKNIALIKQAAALVLPADVNAPDLRDPNDLAILGTALAGHADILISGDKDLLVLKAFQGIPILSPREFIASSET